MQAGTAGQSSQGGATTVITVPIPPIPGVPGQAPVGTPTTQQPWTPPAPRSNDIPEEIIPIMGIVMVTVVSCVLGYPIVRLITRMIERRSDRSVLPAAEVQAQLRALQQSVDAMAIEMERVSEAQRFQAKLLAGQAPKELPRS